MNKELKVLLILIVSVLVTYWFIEPYAHSKLSPHVAPVNYDFSQGDALSTKDNIDMAQKALENAKSRNDEKAIAAAETDLNLAKENQDKATLFWNEVNQIDFSKGDASTGAETFINAGCTACHGVEAAGLPVPMDGATASDAYGVNPPDLSTAGYLYDEKFLAAIIKDPVMALKLGHKFGDETPFPMPGFFGLGGDINQELADIVAYLKSIAPKEMENSAVFDNACSRCHDVKYDNKAMTSNIDALSKYMGSTPPDLSMMIRSKRASYLHEFINDPQKRLPGTSMPRVGLNQQAEDQVVAYLENVGDSKKSEREKTTIWIMIYFAILAVFAGLWKKKVWEKLH
ncbi:MAG: cytochrome c1 [Campylobacter sp.]|nr:cytochrome c1 [Campylobacter sp.]MBQ7675279.1 cytochrome c1 [Campylobacter sp.]MBR0071594.1 cytochrome c1 [Campylobacter sp.]